MDTVDIFFVELCVPAVLYFVHSGQRAHQWMDSFTVEASRTTPSFLCRPRTGSVSATQFIKVMAHVDTLRNSGIKISTFFSNWPNGLGFILC